MIYNVVTLTEASAVTRIVDEIVNYVEQKDQKSKQCEDCVGIHNWPGNITDNTINMILAPPPTRISGQFWCWEARESSPFWLGTVLAGVPEEEEEEQVVEVGDVVVGVLVSGVGICI